MELINDATRKETPLVISAEIMSLHDINFYEKGILALIQNFDISERHCWISNERIHEIMGISIPTITRAIKHLKDLGYIESYMTTTTKGTMRTIEYRGSNQIDERGVINMIRGSNQNDEQYNNINNNKDIIDNYKCFSYEEEKNVSEQKSLTKQFWINYINKVISILENEGNEYSEEEKQTCVKVILYYLEQFEKNRGKQHPTLSYKSLKMVIEQLMWGTESGLIDGIDFFENYQAMIDQYFETRFSWRIDYNICHFMSDTIRDNRFYQTCY